MPFDPKTAKKFNPASAQKVGGFDPSSAQKAEVSSPPTINQAFNAPTEAWNQAMSEFGSGNIGAGVLDVGNYLLRGASLPFSVSAAGLRKVPIVGETLARTVEAPGQMLNAVLYEAPRAAFSPFVGLLPQSVQNLGQNPENAAQTARASGEFSSGATQLLGGAMLGGLSSPTTRLGGIEGPSPITRGVTNISERRATVPIRKANVAMDRAFPPTTKELTRPDDRQRIAPYLAESERRNPVELGTVPKGGNKPSVARQLAKEKVPEIKNVINSQQDEVIQRNGIRPLAGGVNEVANNIESLRNIYTKNIDILKDQSILDEAAKYRKMGEINLSEARDLQRSLNAGLQEFYKKSNESQAAAENYAKPVAEMEKAVESLREQIVRTLDNAGEDGNWYRQKSLDYGAAARIEAAAERNIVRSENPLPPMFTERSSTLYPSRSGLTREVGEHTIGKFFTPDKLARKAMRNYAKSELTPVGAAPPPMTFPPPKLLPAHPIEMGMGPDATSINITPAMVHPSQRKLLAAPGYGKPVELPAQFPNEFTPATSAIHQQTLMDKVRSNMGVEKPYSTGNAQKIGQSLTPQEAELALELYRKGEAPGGQHQFYREVAEGFVEKYFSKADIGKGPLRAYSTKNKAQAVADRIAWIKAGKNPMDYPDLIR